MLPTCQPQPRRLSLTASCIPVYAAGFIPLGRFPVDLKPHAGQCTPPSANQNLSFRTPRCSS
eukprot:scaffold714_cov121-Isochrysis_galbana.AAC.2